MKKSFIIKYLLMHRCSFLRLYHPLICCLSRCCNKSYCYAVDQ